MMRHAAVSILAAGLCGPSAVASLIGDTVTIGHEFPSSGLFLDGPYSTLVVAGSADAITLTPFADHHPGYIVNVEADRILIDFIDNVSFTAGSPIHGVAVQSIDDATNPAWVITSAVFAPGSATTGTLTFTDHAVRVNWQGTFVGVSTHFEILLSGVPAPGAAGLLGLALLKPGRRRRGERQTRAARGQPR